MFNRGPAQERPGRIDSLWGIAMWKRAAGAAFLAASLVAAGLLVACNDGEARVSVPVVSIPVDPIGSWSLAPQPAYSCASGFVSFSIASFVFSDGGGGVLNVSGAPFSMTGLLPTTTGQPIDVTFSTSVPEPSCNETYALSATFSSVNGWSGTFNARFTGSQCAVFPPACVDQAWGIVGTR